MLRNEWKMTHLAAATLVIATVLAPSSLSNEGSSGTAGIELLTPTKGVDFGGFLKSLYKSVKQNWFAVMPGEVQTQKQKGIVVLRFAVRNDGSLPDEYPVLETSSGEKNLDEAALSAVKRSAPFKGFPQEFTGPYIELRFTFRYNMP